MENKNTMLLTVIAVATLLVAVVGATFAYFTVSNATGEATTTVTAKAEAVATFALSNANPALVLEVTAQEMAQGNQKAYYAVKSGTDAKNTTKSTPLEVAKLTVTAPGESSYTCTTTLTVGATGTMAESLVAGDASVTFSGQATGTIDLASAELTKKKTVDATFKLNKSTLSQSVNAVVALNNTSKVQNDLAGKNLSVTITAGAVTCNLDAE